MGNYVNTGNAGFAAVLASGIGDADVVFIPKKHSKWNKTEDGAINQIRRNQYPQALKDYGGEMILVGINYDVKSKKHTCRIEKLER